MIERGPASQAPRNDVSIMRMIPKRGCRFSEKDHAQTCMAHDPEKHAPDVIRSGCRFSEKIVRNL